MIGRKENFLIFFPKYPVELEKELIEIVNKNLPFFKIDFTSDIAFDYGNRREERRIFFP